MFNSEKSCFWGSGQENLGSDCLSISEVKVAILNKTYKVLEIL